MIKCPWCYAVGESKCTGRKTTHYKKGRGIYVRRKRICKACGKAFFTIEYIKAEDKEDDSLH